jgi:hypothetical protein
MANRPTGFGMTAELKKKVRKYLLSITLDYTNKNAIYDPSIRIVTL